MTRKIVQIAVANETKYSYGGTVALCDDGTVWSLAHTEDAEWEELPPIPRDRPIRGSAPIIAMARDKSAFYTAE